MATEPIKIEGLNQFVGNLKTIDAGLPKAVRRAFNEAADVVVDDASPRVPRRSGRARGSVRSRSTQRFARISGGGGKAPHYPWLDFGGRVGRRGSARRPFLTEGRYIYRSYFEARASGEFERVMVRALLDVVSSAGIEVD
jgi:hypothetical protein